MKMTVDLHAEKVAETRNLVAEKSLKKAIDLVTPLFEIKDLDTFKKDFVAYVLAYIKKDKVLKYVDIHKLIDITTLQLHFNRYKDYQDSRTNFDLVAETPEQKAMFLYATELCNIINRHPQKHNIHYIPLLIKDYQIFKVDYHAILQLN